IPYFRLTWLYFATVNPYPEIIKLLFRNWQKWNYGRFAFVGFFLNASVPPRSLAQAPKTSHHFQWKPPDICATNHDNKTGRNEVGEYRMRLNDLYAHLVSQYLTRSILGIPESR